MSKILTGLDVFGEDYWKKLKGYRLGLLSNHASLDSRLNSAKSVISMRLPDQLKALFGPQHGHGGEDQENMIETDHSYESDSGLPVFSLYSDTREPLPEMLDLIDALIIDLQDVGTRVYTYASTMLNCLRALAGSGKKVIMLDRPNPLGGDVLEGNLLKPDLYSFVGPFRLPMRHGLTMAEMARLFRDVFDIDSDLDVVPMKGWRRKMLWQETGLKWVMPSPNMPLPETAQVYPGQVLLEGTNLSEGRGTCRPFEIFGAPYLDPERVKRELSSLLADGCILQEFSFRPTFHKWEGEICRGFMIHIVDHFAYSPYLATIALLKAIAETHKGQFEWKEPPYEYEYERMPIDILTGDSTLRKIIESGGNLFTLKDEWEAELKDYLEWREPYLLYR